VRSHVKGLWPAPLARVAISALALLALALSYALLGTSHATGSPTAAPASVRRSPGHAPAGRRVEVIVQLNRGVPLSQGRTLVRSLGGTAGIDLPIINGLSARMSVAAQRRLAASPLVHAVTLNAPIKSTCTNFSPGHLATSFDGSVGATRLWNHSTGRGIGVAVIDSGVQGDLPDFLTGQGASVSRVVASAVIDPNSTSTAADTYGHGTLVAGLIAGNGGDRDSSDPVYGQYAGTAPDASLISVKVADDTGQATTLDAIYGLQFVVDHKADYNIQVVNLSFRSTTAESYTTDPLDAAVEQAWFDGITVVAAAGNLGTASDAVSYAPGNDPYVITVGAADDEGTSSTWNDVEASWSSQGVTQDGFQKPDVLAPGAHIVSTLAPNSTFATLCPGCVTQGAYFQASGTSLAAPIVSGIVADLLAAHPDWTPDMVKGAITSTAIPLHGGGSEVQGNAAYWATGAQLVSDQALTPNQLIDPDTGEIDYSTASWSAGTWSPAADPLTASWSTASWSCESCSSDASGDTTPTTASWSNVGWATNWG
jgi:serine protease AprX